MEGKLAKGESSSGPQMGKQWAGGQSHIHRKNGKVPSPYAFEGLCSAYRGMSLWKVFLNFYS